ncbi:hypothetical protein BH09ACT8_BH09ACT8_30910 [soil metagenome]
MLPGIMTPDRANSQPTARTAPARPHPGVASRQRNPPRGQIPSAPSPRVTIGAEGTTPMFSYHAAHAKVRRARGPASEHLCVDCRTRQADQWSYDHQDAHERRWRNLRYSTDPARYQPRCTRCHRLFDLRASRAPVSFTPPPDTETHRWCSRCFMLHPVRRCTDCGTALADAHRIGQVRCRECALLQANRHQDTDQPPPTASRGTQQAAGPIAAAARG